MADLPTTLSWTVHPIVENWHKSVLLGLFLALLLFGIYLGFQSIYVALISGIVLIGSLYKYFLPFHHQCEADRLIITSCCYRLERSWETFRSFYVDANGVLLSPFARPTRLENFRGVYVRFGKHTPEEVVDFITSKIKSETSP
ncbi:MAG: hypothetical protein OXI24_15880 [Candidatus Poribacteria bacterium]|nr:hypothetical protein [Candidatus Poribacteria bacterium]